jgi:hypothetical protein
MTDWRVRLVSDTVADWTVELDPERGELLMNPVALGLTPTREHREQLIKLGATLIMHLRSHPAASDEDLAAVAADVLAASAAS